MPSGFAEAHNKEHAKSDTGFLTKAAYLDLFEKVRAASTAAVAGADLDKASTGEMAGFAPKLGDFFLLIANHTMMHVGQFTAVRRKDAASNARIAEALRAVLPGPRPPATLAPALAEAGRLTRPEPAAPPVEADAAPPLPPPPSLPVA